MADETEQTQDSRGAGRPTVATSGGGWLRRYPPLVLFLVALLIAVVVLPSALNVPQSNPTTVLEYAPVPPEEQENQPITTQLGGFSSLNAAATSSLSLPPAPGRIDPSAKRPLTKKCVGGRQTEDPNSPPCQPFFEGDNGGNTWIGVNRDEINIVIYQDAVTTVGGNQGVGLSPGAGTYCDIDIMDCNGDGRPDSDPHVWVRIHNAFSRYFNSRFQTYGRHVHAYMYWTSGSTNSSSARRRSDAADNFQRYKPFAVMPQAWTGPFVTDYVDSMARRGSMLYSTFYGYPSSFYAKYQPQVWGFWPSVEVWADMFTGYLCNKVAGSKVNHAGPEYTGQARKYGLYYTTDAGFPGLRLFKDRVSAGIKACGIDWGNREYTFPYAGWAADTEGDRTYGARNVAAMRGDGVNTLIWLGGIEPETSKAAAQQGYYPEVVIAGDGDTDGNSYGQLQDQSFWQNVWTMTYQIPSARNAEDPAYVAYKEADPSGQDYDWAIANGDYRFWFLMMTGIQVAGPRLKPSTVDAGMHAIQRRKSTSPYIPAQFFYPGDYTSVKDAAEAFYDPSGIDPNGNQGCYRMVRNGLRYAGDSWVEARGAGIDVYGYRNPDECTGYAPSNRVRAGQPRPPGS